MNSTIALWYSRKSKSALKGNPPKLEVHINLWRHQAPKEDYNILDIGIRVLDPQDLGDLKLFVPISHKNYDLVDLGCRLNDVPTLSAVFNETLKISGDADGSKSFEVLKRDKHYVTVHPCEIGKDISVEPVCDDAAILATWDKAFCERLREPGEHYIRIRFNLKNGCQSIFSKDTSSEDGVLLSSFSVSEITEVRFNEVRSLPKEVVDRAVSEKWEEPNVHTLHYFLVRDTSFDLVASHSSFRKMRRLEATIWDDYLKPALPKSTAENMIIYHWRSGGQPESHVADVVTLAKFRRTRNNLLPYILFVIALGALGSALHAFVISMLSGSDRLVSTFAAIILGLAIAVSMALWNKMGREK